MFDNAVLTLRKELDKIGGEIFSEKMDKYISEVQYETGDDEVKKKIESQNFLLNLLNGKYKTEKYDLFIEYLNAIKILKEASNVSK
jgi:hypothetical protein